MTWYRLVIEEIKDSEVITNYAGRVDAVQVKGAQDQEVYLTFRLRAHVARVEETPHGICFPETVPSGLETMVP
jgi:hypothetical protein